MNENQFVEPRERFVENTKVRFYKTLDFFVLIIYVLIVSLSSFLADYFMILVIEFFLSDDISKYSVVSQFFDWYKIGTALLVFIVAMLHAIYSAFSQVKFEVEI